MHYIMAELRIKEVCKEKGVKVMDLSTMIGVSQTNTSNIINGKVNPSLETLEKIASALNVPMWQLFASPEEIQPQSDGVSITCPNCGKEFEVELKAKER